MEIIFSALLVLGLVAMLVTTYLVPTIKVLWDTFSNNKSQKTDNRSLAQILADWRKAHPNAPEPTIRLKDKKGV